MAMDLQTTERRALLAKIQAVAGTPETLDPADDAILVLGGEFRFQTDELAREIDRPGHGAHPHVNVKRRASYGGAIELRGAATVGAAAPIGRILRGCGFVEVLEDTGPSPAIGAYYTLANADYEMLTLEGFDSGERVSGADARGVITQIELSIRNFARANFQLLGLPAEVPVADAALPAAVLSAFQFPVAIETESFEVDLNGTKLNAISLTIDTQAQVEIYEGSETRFVYPRAKYMPTGTLRVFKEQRSTFNPEAVALAHTQIPIYAEIVGGGETVRLDLANVQLGVPQPSDQDGLRAWDIPIKGVGSSPTNALALSFLEPPAP